MQEQPETSSREWLVALGVPGVAYGAGFAVLSFHFWLGIAIAYLAAALFLIDWLVVSQRKRAGTRCLVALVPIAATALVTWIGFRPAPINISATTAENNYGDETTIAGVKWKPAYADLRMIITNDTTENYTNLVVVVRTDLMIANVGALSPLSQCQQEAYMGGMVISGASVAIKGANGPDDHVIPLMTGDGSPTAATEYKISCDKILGRDHLELVIAVTSQLFQKHHARKNPSWLSWDIQYDAYGRSHSANNNKCFITNCKEVTAPQ
jgi:hypothetical protein